MRSDDHGISGNFALKMLGNSRLAWLVFVAGMVLTGVVWHAVKTWEEEKAYKEFIIHANDTLDAVRQRLAVYSGILRGARGLFAASDEVTRDEWRRFSAVTGLDGHYSGVHSFAFIRYVAAHEKAAFEKRVRDGAHVAGYPGFAISPAGERDDYFPIEYIEPESEYRALLGVDRGADEDTRKTLERARDSGQLTASGRLRSAVETPGAAPYFLMVLPIYRNGANLASLETRRAALLGFVTARIEVTTLLKEIASSGAREELFFELYDGGSMMEKAPLMKPENLLYAEDGVNSLRAQATAAGHLTHKTAIDVGGRNWLFFFGSRPEFSAVGGYLPVVVLLGGLVTSALMFALVLVLVAQRQRVMADVVRQKSLFSQVLDALPLNVFLKDRNFRFVLVNEEAARTIGMSKEAAAGKTNFDVFPQDVAARLLEYDEYVFAEERLVMREERVVCNQQEKILLAGKKIIRLPGSNEPMLLGFSFDITERRRLEQEAARAHANESSRSLADAVGEGLIGVDLSRRIVFANPKAQEILAIPESQMQGNQLADIVQAITADGSALTGDTCPAWKVIAAGQTFETDDWTFRRGDGSRFPVNLVMAPIRENNNISGAVLSFQDITARHQSEAMQTQHMVELARVNAELDEFTYVASHDLQEPVRKLVAFSEWLKKDLGEGLPPRAEQDLGFIIDASQRMQRLVADLLALSRTGKVSMVSGNVALDEAVERALAVLELRIAESGATIQRTPLPVVWGDLTLLTQLYQNLIGNALKFIGDAPPEISLTAQQIDGDWVFGVRDNGIGIPAQYADQVFQPFKRLHGRGQFEGSGVGLSICRKVVERHHGRIWVESEEGQGAWFQFTLGGNH